MSQSSAIEWTDATWNPVTGCTKITAGCEFCYAERFAERFRGVQNHPYEHGFDLQLRPERLKQPLSWRKPKMIFVNSMSDLFHKEVPHDFIHAVFNTMETADWHIFQLLTKRSSLMRDFINRRYFDRPVPPHIWLGVSVEDRKGTARIRHLRQTNASIRFLSVEPLIEKIDVLNLNDIHWVIVGGESGQRARPMKKEWAVHVRDLCLANQVPFFFKQWGTWSKDGVKRSKTDNGRCLNGREWNDMPMDRMDILRKQGDREQQRTISLGN